MPDVEKSAGEPRIENEKKAVTQQEIDAQKICEMLGLPLEENRDALASFLRKEFWSPAIAVRKPELKKEYDTFLAIEGKPLLDRFNDALTVGVLLNEEANRLRPKWHVFMAKQEQFEKHWEAISRPLFMQSIELPPGISSEDFQLFMSHAFEKPVEPPPDAEAKMRAEYRLIEKRRLELLPQIRRMERDGSVSLRFRLAMRKDIVDFITWRFRLDQKIIQPKSAHWFFAAVGVTLQNIVQEVGEEVAEEGAAGKGGVGIAVFRSGFYNFPLPVQEAIVEQLSKHLSAKGILLFDAAALRTLQEFQPQKFQNLIKSIQGALTGDRVAAFENLQKLSAMSEASAQKLTDGIREVLKKNLPPDGRLLHNRNWFLHHIDDLEHLDPKMRKFLIRGLLDVENALAARGMKVEEFRRLRKEVDWRALQRSGFLHEVADIIRNPMTFIIFVLYLKDCPDKVDGAIKLTMMYAGSILINRGQGMLVKRLPPRYAKFFKKPVFGFSAAFALMWLSGSMGGIDIAAKWIDERFFDKDGTFREGVHRCLALLALEDLAKMVREGADLMDMSPALTPESFFQYFLRKDSRGKYFAQPLPEDPSSPEAKKRGRWWNIDIDRIVRLEDPLIRDQERIDLLACERFDENKIARLAWEFYTMQVPYLRKLIDQKHSLFVMAKEKLNIPFTTWKLAMEQLVDIVTRDTGDPQNQEVLEEALNSGNRSPLGIIHAKIQGLGSNDGLRTRWEQKVVKNAEETALLTGLYRHLRWNGVSIYNRKAWLDDRVINGETRAPQIVEDGILAELIYNVRKTCAREKYRRHPFNKAEKAVPDGLGSKPLPSPPIRFD